MNKHPQFQALTWAIVAFTLFLHACAYNKGIVVLLPEKEGRDAAVAVRHSESEVILNVPYAAARQTSYGPQVYTSNPQEVETLFGAALGALPARPVQFTLHFVEGTDEFTEDSKQIIDGVFAAIAKRPVPDILVVGHTDKVGSDQYNDALSRQRAGVVRAGLIDKGIAPENIVAVGRGKRDPIVPTAEGIAEPRNRRVEIVVR